LHGLGWKRLQIHISLLKNEIKKNAILSHPPLIRQYGYISFLNFTKFLC
jgi:hypothetical protein